MKRETEIKQLLISNAIRLIGTGGFEAATTKALAYSDGDLPDLKMNEAYIYRLFDSKEHIYEAAFSVLDTELFYAFKRAVDRVGTLNSNDKDAFFTFFENAWKFILRNEERCRFYVRYYHSIYFKGSSLENHNKHFEIIVNEMTSAFKEEADVFAIMHAVFTTLLDFAIRVYNGDLEDNEINRIHIFNVLYSMMSTYFKDPAEAS